MSEAATTPDPARDPYHLVGLTLAGKYRLVEYVGSGGMGVVCRAVVADTGRRVAVKILKPDIVANDGECARLFEQEVEVVRRLEHPNVVRLFDSGTDQGYSFMVMEWLDGQTLEEAVSAGQLSLERIDRILAQVCGALEAAHAERIIHLDLKPGNIFLLNDGRPDDVVKVIDFGMSRVLTRESGTTVTRFRGTYQYCSPEQFGGRVSSRSDIYSLGATLYHLLTGVVPFGMSYVVAKRHRDRELPPLPAIRGVRPEVPPAVERVVKQALSRDPGKRQQSARQLYEDFHRAAFGATTLKFPQPSPPGLSSGLRASPKEAPASWAGVALSLALSSLVAVTVFFYYFNFDGLAPGRGEPDASRPAPEAQAPRPTPPESSPYESRPARPAGASRQPVTSESPVARARGARVPSSAIEPDDAHAVAPAPGATAGGEEFVERGEVVVPADAVQRLMALINAERQSRGLKPLSQDGKLSEVAQQHSADMARQNYLAHRDRSGRDLSARARDAGLRGWKAIGENIAYNQGYDDPEGFAVERWMASPNHRRNILNKDYTHAGVGVARAEDGRVFFTQVLMKR